MEILPINYTDNYSCDGHVVKYSNFIEISQGGPEVGKLTIDGQSIGSKVNYFGGPPFFYEGRMFVPKLKKSGLGWRFKICVIDLGDLSVQEIGNNEDLILISNVDKTLVHYFTGNPNTTAKSVSWK